MTKPVRIQRRRVKGFDMQAASLAVNGLPCVSVTRPGRWGNPCRVGMYAGYTAADAVADFKRWLARDPTVRSFENVFGKPPTTAEIIAAMRGKNVACFCQIVNMHGGYVACHADVLLSIANDIPMNEVIRENVRRANGQAV